MYNTISIASFVKDVYVEFRVNPYKIQQTLKIVAQGHKLTCLLVWYDNLQYKYHVTCIGSKYIKRSSFCIHVFCTCIYQAYLLFSRSVQSYMLSQDIIGVIRFINPAELDEQEGDLENAKLFTRTTPVSTVRSFLSLMILNLINQTNTAWSCLYSGSWQLRTKAITSFGKKCYLEQNISPEM